MAQEDSILPPGAAAVCHKRGEHGERYLYDAHDDGSMNQGALSMSRFHMHVVVENLDISSRFYTALFGVEPTTVKEDYIKWALDDPSINFVITSRGHIPGLDHVGIQGIAWEAFRSLHPIPTFNDETSEPAVYGCCAPDLGSVGCNR
jgi:hypothetical protein